ncbi:MAG: TldD/PmbA family protein [Chloroflexi bacterium]|nr:TldD/PmbA family protein [Chloroflexota bacterium]
MIGEAGLKAAAERVLRFAQGEGRAAEVVLISVDDALTRYANTEIHPHVAERDVNVHVRIAIGRRAGSASANGLDDETLRNVVERATTIARLQRENPDFPGFPGPYRTAALDSGWTASTREATPEARAERVAVVCRRAHEAGFTAAGACSTRVTETLVANSTGTYGYNVDSHARLQAVVFGETSSGYSVRQGVDFASIDAELVANEAAGKAERGRNPEDLEPGEYDVVLEPYATEDIIRFIAYLGLQGRALLEKTSFATGKLGERLFDEQITLRDDPLDPASIPQPFDYEGVPKRPLTLVNAGIVEAVTYDSLTAAKAGAKTTGHALLGGSYFGPVATHLSLQPGALNREALIGQIDRGLLVTRFWYTRPVHPLTVTVTGMTRDSTFLIERGEITRPVKNLRFTQSYVKALQRVIGVGAESLLAGDSYGNPVARRHSPFGASRSRARASIRGW